MAGIQYHNIGRHYFDWLMDSNGRRRTTITNICVHVCYNLFRLCECVCVCVIACRRLATGRRLTEVGRGRRWRPAGAGRGGGTSSWSSARPPYGRSLRHQPVSLAPTRPDSHSRRPPPLNHRPSVRHKSCLAGARSFRWPPGRAGRQHKTRVRTSRRPSCPCQDPGHDFIIFSTGAPIGGGGAPIYLCTSAASILPPQQRPSPAWTTRTKSSGRAPAAAIAK
jgi:hypothetical protein